MPPPHKTLRTDNANKTVGQINENIEPTNCLANEENQRRGSQLLQRISVAIQMGNAASVLGTLPERNREELPMD